MELRGDRSVPRERDLSQLQSLADAGDTVNSGRKAKWSLAVRLQVRYFHKTGTRFSTKERTGTRKKEGG